MNIRSKRKNSSKVRSTTILAVSHNGQVVMAGDGQVTNANTVLKSHAKKIQRLQHGKVLAGFAGSVADALSLFDKFDEKLAEFKGNLLRSAVELAKLWRTDKYLRRLEAMLVVADRERILIISGSGDVVEPDDNVAAIGSGAAYAVAAARALLRHSNLTAEEIVKEAMKITSELCIYTNDQVILEKIE